MLLAEAQGIAHGNLSNISLRVPNPDKPTFAWVTFLVRRVRTQHPNDGEIQPACFFDMHLFPPQNFDRTSFGILPLKMPIRIAIGVWIAHLQAISIFAWCPTFSRRGMSRPIKTPFAFDAAQDIHA